LPQRLALWRQSGASLLLSEITHPAQANGCTDLIEELKDIGGCPDLPGSLRIEIIGVDICETVARLMGRHYTSARHTVNSIIQSDQWCLGQENGFDADE
jgi:hypothetical protein